MVRSVTLQTDGKILVGGDFSYFGGPRRGSILRFNSDYSIDNTFASPVLTDFSRTAEIFKLAQQADGKLLVGGIHYTNPPATRGLIRLNANGSVDGSFTNGALNDGRAHDFAIQSNQKIIVLGDFSYTHKGIARLNSNGSNDGTYNLGTGFLGVAYSIQLQTDQKALIAGSFTQFNGSAVKPIIRLNSDGTLDNSFVLGSADTNCNKIKLQTDGNLIAACNGGIRRILTDGSIDSGFSSTYSGVGVRFIETLPAGKSLIALSTGTVLRLNSDGSRDMTFYVPVTAYSAMILSPTKYWLGGIFDLYYQTPVMNSVIVESL